MLHKVMKITDKIIYYWLLITAHCFGILPLRIQYIISDILRFFVYTVFRYRVKVVRINLSRSFPEKSKDELRLIERKFYKHFVDIMLESLVLITISPEKIKKRFVYTNPELLNELLKQRSVLTTMAHLGSWEFTINYSLYTTQPVLAVYHPLKSLGFEHFYYKMRSKYGVEPTPMKSIGRQIAKRNSENIAVALIADQNPPNINVNWVDFLNQKTVFFKGMETFAVRYDMAVVFLNVKRVKRGYYEGTFSQIYNGTDAVEENEIVEKYAASLEIAIKEYPHIWLWTHKRWKVQPNNESVYD